ncbi:hypothetical protein Tco_0494784 [Tanacetum coccineum]
MYQTTKAVGIEKEAKNFKAQEVKEGGLASRVESSNDVSLGAQEDVSKHRRKIADLDADEEVTLIDETRERYDEEMLFNVQDDLQVVTTASTTTTVDELTLAQTLIEIKAAKPKAVTIAATTTTTTRPKARGVVVQEPTEEPLKKKDQITLDEELALKLQAEEQAELEKERVAQEEASRAANIEELDRIQAMIDVDEQLAARLQAEEQEQFSSEEKSRMLVELIAKRKKFFVAESSRAKK